MPQLAVTQEVPDALALETGLAFEEVQQRIGIAYAAAGLKHRVVAFYLADVDARGLHQLDGCRSAAQWAAHRFGMCRREARDLLVAGRALVDLPEIDRAFAEGKLCWSKVRELIRVAVPEHETKWLQLALRLHTDELHLQVQLAQPGEPPRNPDDRKGLPEIRLNLNATMPPDVYAKWEQVRRKLTDEAGKPMREWECLDALFERELQRAPENPARDTGCSYTVVMRTATDEEDATVETEDGPIPVDPVIAEMLACDAGVCSDHDHEADRQVPPHLRRKVLNRDNRKCRCCGSPHSLHVHHIIAWSKGGKTRIKNLITVCRNCHALIHAGLIILVGDVKSCEFHTAEGVNLHGPGALPEKFPPSGGYEFRPGRPLSKEEADSRAVGPETGDDESGTVCQPRPARLDDMVGQRRIVESVKTAIAAARIRGEPVDHQLLTGPPGLGKTTMARAIAAEIGVRLHDTTGSCLRTADDLVQLLIGLGEREIVFIDEIHGMGPRVTDIVHRAMEDRRVSVVLRSGTLCRAVTLELPPFSLIGATTEPGQLTPAFMGRFVYQHLLTYYAPPEMAEILGHAAPHFGLELDVLAATRLALVSRGTPRHGIALLRQVHNDAVADGRRAVDAAYMQRTLDRLRIDDDSLGPVDRQYLKLLRSRGKPVGLGQAARILGVDARTLQRDHEPYLLRMDLMDVTPNGRVAPAGAGQGSTRLQLVRDPERPGA
jgi:Holliday junction DNA helicase RuvB